METKRFYCPCCGNEMIGIMLLSMPPKPQWMCAKCQFTTIDNTVLLNEQSKETDDNE